MDESVLLRRFDLRAVNYSDRIKAWFDIIVIVCLPLNVCFKSYSLMEEKITAENIQLNYFLLCLSAAFWYIIDIVQTEKPRSNIPLAVFADFIHGQI